MIKKIISLITLTCVLCASVVFAEDRSLEELYEMYMSDVADIKLESNYFKLLSIATYSSASFSAVPFTK